VGSPLGEAATRAAGQAAFGTAPERLGVVEGLPWLRGGSAHR